MRPHDISSGASYVPERGDVVWVDFDPQAEHEQAGRRPGLVLSPATYNRPAQLALICPLTRQKKGYPYEVEVPDGLLVSGVILADQTKSFDWRARRLIYICRMPSFVVTEVAEKLLTLLPE